MSSHDHPDHAPCGDAPSYLLGALEPQRAQRFLEHAADCAVCRDELSALTPAVEMLAESVVQVAAPKDLKQRVMSTVRAEAASDESRRRSFSLPAWRLRPVAWAGACGALAAVVVALVIATLGSSSGGGGIHSISAHVTLPGTVATLHQSSGHTWLTVAHMPQPGSGRVYEVWIGHGTGQLRATSALFAPTTRGDGIVAVPGRLSDGSEVLVTSEPAGGSPKPTRAAVIIARV